MFAPRPANNACVLVLLPCLTGSSLASFATTVLTEYRPLAAVQVPTVTGAAVIPAAMAPVYVPLSVLTTVPFWSAIVTVTPWAPPALATVPWLRSVVVNVTALPADGLFGDHAVAATRSELGTGLTTSAVEPV